MDGFYSWRGNDLHLHVHVLPRSSSNTVAGIHNGALKVKLTAPPVDGKANRFLVKFLANEFDVPASQISIVRGQSGRDKYLCISAPSSIPGWLQ